MAAGGSAIRAGRAFVELYADESKLVRGLKSAENALKSWGASVVSIGSKIFAAGAGIVAAFTPAIALFVSMGSELADMSARTGVAVEELSSLAYAAQQTGADSATLEGAIRKMQKTIAEAGEGSESAVDALAALGLTAADLAGMTPDEQLRRLAYGLSAIEDPGKKAAAAMGVLGKSGTMLVPMLGNGIDALTEMEDRARALGLVMSEEDAAAADTLGDIWDELIALGKSFAKTIGAALAPALISVGSQIVEVTSGFVRWMDANRGLVVSVATFGLGLAAVGSAIVGVGLALSVAGVAIGGFLAAVSAVGAVIGAIATAAAAIVSPVGLAIAAVVALAGSLIYFSGVGSATVEFLKGVAGQIQNVFGGIVAEIKNGDLQGAWQIVMLASNIAIQKGMLEAKRFVYETLQSIRKMIVDTAKMIPGRFGKLGKIVSVGAGGVIDATFGGNRAAVNKGFDKEQAAIDAASGLLKSMIDSAKKEAETRFAPAPKLPTLPQLDESLPNGGKNQAAAGTFNAVGAGRLGGMGAVWNRIAKAAEETAKNTGDIKRKKGLAFQ